MQDLYKGTGSVLDQTRRGAIYWHDGTLMVDVGQGPKPVISAVVIMALDAGDGVRGSHAEASCMFGPLVPAMEAVGYFLAANPVAAHVAQGICTIARTGNFQGLPAAVVAAMQDQKPQDKDADGGQGDGHGA